MSELDEVLQTGFNESPLGYDNVEWFVDEVLKLEIKMAIYLKNTNKDTIMNEEDEENYRNNYICRFCEKKTF